MDDTAAMGLFYIVRLCAAAVIFMLGYYGARGIENRYGPGAAQLPPIAWGFLFAFCLLPALIAAFIVNARARSKFNQRQSAGGHGWPPPPSNPGPTQWPSSSPERGGGGAVPGQTILPGQ